MKRSISIDFLVTVGILGLIVITAIIVNIATSPSNWEFSKAYTLTKDNLVLLRDEIDEETTDLTIKKLEESRAPVTYLYIDSPGGSVNDGMRLVQYLQDTPKDIVCIAEHAMSMAFTIMQACDTRIVMKSSIMMQHEMTGGSPAMQESNAESFRKFKQQLQDAAHSVDANRMGINLKTYKEMIRDDLWYYGVNAVRDNAADFVGFVTCSPELMNTTSSIKINTIFGAIPVEVNNCPVMHLMKLAAPTR